MTAVACGSDDSDSSAGSTSSSSAGQATTSAAAATTATTAAAKEPASMAEWEALWAQERAAEVKRIKDNKWGKSADGKTVTGPNGFTIDLTKCPAGWSDTEGLTDTEIKIGAATPLSGTAADGGNWTRGADTWFKYQSSQHAFKDSTGKDRTINFFYKDDGYDAARTIPIVDELMDSDKVFALWTLGTPSGLKIYDKINQRCVPQPVLISGSPAWGDPVNHPWTSGSLLSYSTEAVIWGAFIDNHIAELTASDGKATIAALIANSDFGATYDSSFRAVIAQSPNKDKIDFVTEKLEITAPTVTDPMTTLASKNPDMFIAMTGATQCPQISKEKVGGDGSQSNGWYIVGGGFKDFNSDAAAADPFVAGGRKILADNGLD